MTALLKRAWHLFLNRLRRNNNKIIATLLTLILTKCSEILSIKKLALPLRQVLSLVQTSDPLSHNSPATIDVVIPCHPKDFARLPLVLEGIQRSVLNPIHAIRLITPDEAVDRLKNLFPHVQVIADSTLLDKRLNAVVEDHFSTARHAWIRQQLLKFMAVLSSEAQGTLVIDSDTVLLRPRIWLDVQGVQCLDIAFEYHPPYMDHLRHFLNMSIFPASFTTHHQLMKRDILQVLFGPHGDRLSEWIRTGDKFENSAISDYETYGQFAVARFSYQIKFSKWNNASGNFDLLVNRSYESIKKDYNLFSSVSFHSYI